MGIQVSKLDSLQTQTYPPIALKTPGSSSHLEYGSLLPQGIYPCSSCDYNVKAVRKFIKEGLLAPFFIGLNEPPEGTEHNQAVEPSSPSKIDTPKKTSNTVSMLVMRNKIKDRFLLLRSSSTCQRTDQLLYSHTIECPICLLTYPDCLNYTRCCDKPICTDCFLQLRRSDELPLVPAACPFCVQPNLGVIHFPPSWSQQHDNFKKQRMDLYVLWEHEGEQQGEQQGRKRRRKKLGPNDRNVVLVDQVRPNWQDQLGLKSRRHTNDSYPLNSDQIWVQHRRNPRRFSGSMSGSGTTRRIIVRPTMQSSLTSRTM